jgi:hypothetical protein
LGSHDNIVMPESRKRWEATPLIPRRVSGEEALGLSAEAKEEPMQ